MSLFCRKKSCRRRRERPLVWAPSLAGAAAGAAVVVVIVLSFGSSRDGREKGLRSDRYRTPPGLARASKGKGRSVVAAAGVDGQHVDGCFFDGVFVVEAGLERLF